MKFANLQGKFYSERQQIGQAMGYLFSFFYFRFYLIVNLGLNFLIWLFVFIINANTSQRLIKLHYNVDFGVDLIGEVGRLFIIPLLGLIIIFINIILVAINSKHKNLKFIVNLLLGGALAVNVFLLIALGSIYLINFR